MHVHACVRLDGGGEICAHKQRATGSRWVAVEERDHGSGGKITAAQLNQSCGLCSGTIASLPPPGCSRLCTHEPCCTRMRRSLHFMIPLSLSAVVTCDRQCDEGESNVAVICFRLPHINVLIDESLVPSVMHFF